MIDYIALNDPVVDWLFFLAIGACVCLVVSALGHICDLFLYWRMYK